jgi:hypothetical protein
MRATDEFLRRIDDWRREQPDIPSRAKSIRRLVETALGPERARVVGTDVRSLAREYGPEALDALREVARDPAAPLSARKLAHSALRTRGISEKP